MNRKQSRTLLGTNERKCFNLKKVEVSLMFSYFHNWTLIIIVKRFWFLICFYIRIDLLKLCVPNISQLPKLQSEYSEFTRKPLTTLMHCKNSDYMTQSKPTSFSLKSQLSIQKPSCNHRKPQHPPPINSILI